jgi:AcrR family transcriptional regulator
MSEGTVDPEAIDRTLGLLWRAQAGEPERRRGPKQKVSVDEVVRAGIALADADGLGVFSVRQVAEHLGIGTMSIYTYVPGRSELIGLMVDEAMSEAELHNHDGSLHARLTSMAKQLWDEAHRHPWLLQVDLARPWIGPHAMNRYEWQLAALEGSGFTDLEMDNIVTTVTSIAQSSARTSLGSQDAKARSGITDAQWWQINAPVLDRFVRVEEYPLATRVGQAAGQEYNAVSSPQQAMEFALDRLFHGLDLLRKSR